MTALSFDPRTGTATPAPDDSTEEELERVVCSSASAAEKVANSSPLQRSVWLNSLADELEASSDRLAGLANEETGLGLVRLTGEISRSAAALRFYGTVAVEGSWLNAVIDESHQGRPDLRRANTSLGPVGVFGASNFPFAYGVLGNDTGSALAAGCPVVVKAHPAHPRLSAALAEIAGIALARAGAPAGTFGIVFGYQSGPRLVTHPAVRAVGFTGSEAGGMALWQLAATRAEHIPVYAEMGTVNCVVVTRSGAAERHEEIAAGFVESFTLGMGQFCTKPGLILVPTGSGIPDQIAECLTEVAPAGWLLTSGIADAYSRGVADLIAAGARAVTTTPAASEGWSASPTLLSVDVIDLRQGSALLSEVFGPVALVAEYADDAELDRVLYALPGSLAAAVHGGTDDADIIAALVQRLAGKAGRIVVNGWPTGVSVTWAQQHGGPWPATTYPSVSSVGAAALLRFIRPVAYQDVPDDALPPPLKRSNPWGIARRTNGRPAE